MRWTDGSREAYFDSALTYPIQWAILESSCAIAARTSVIVSWHVDIALSKNVLSTDAPIVKGKMMAISHGGTQRTTQLQCKCTEQTATIQSGHRSSWYITHTQSDVNDLSV